MSKTTRNNNSANQKPPSETVLVNEAELLQNGQISSLPVADDLVDPLSLLSSVDIPAYRSDEEIDAAYNPIEADQEEDSIIIDGERTKLLTTHFDPIIAEELPKINKVAIKKIERYKFRMGLEKQKGNPKLMPGAKHRLVVGKKGGRFITGLEEYPEIRSQLERALGVNLSAESKFWINFVIEIEDKEHGHILNFDDPVFGNRNKLIFYALKAQDLVANGYHEYKGGVKPFAEWYIENKDAEAEAAQKQMSDEIQASELFNEMSQSKRQLVGKLCGVTVYGLSPNAASVEVWKWLRDDKNGAANAATFIKQASQDDTTIAVSTLVKDAIKTNVFRRNRFQEYEFKQEPLGATEDVIIHKLLNPSNAALRVAITNMVNAKGG